MSWMRPLTVALAALAIAAVPVLDGPALAGHSDDPPPKMRVLATGDSMIQYPDIELKKRLQQRKVLQRFTTDARVGTGISKTRQLDWVALAKRQTRKYRPYVTVMFIGANEGFAFRRDGKNVSCCSTRWVEIYASRVRKMMDYYARGQTGHVYWLTLPAPQPRSFRSVFAAVNRALHRAVKGRRDGVRLIDTWEVFTPGGKFRRRMTWNGRKYTVRQDDGIHLTVKGASIAAQLIVRQMRTDGVLEK